MKDMDNCNDYVQRALFLKKMELLSRISPEQCSKFFLNEFIWDLKLKYEFSDIIARNSNLDIVIDNSPISHNTIFVSWLQGFDNAPLLVKKCLESVRVFCPNFNIVTIDERNVCDYIDIPKFIIEKHSHGLIPHAHFSDIIRTLLLEKYGGIWLDATVYLTDSYTINNIVSRSSFFAYHLAPAAYRKFDIWLLAASKDHVLLRILKDFLFSYWEKYSFPCNYFVTTIFLNIALELYPNIYCKIPRFYAYNCFLMSRLLLSKFDMSVYENILHASDVHKLSCRIEKKSMPYPTFFDHIIP